MPSNFELTKQALRGLLRYNRKTGMFTRLSNKKEAGYLTKKGYVKIVIKGKQYAAHRLAWLYVHGEWPAGEIDHKNRIKSDNRIINLRDTTKNKNQQNSKLRTDNKSGVKGVSWHTHHGKWVAQIRVDGKNYHLGYFDTLEEAEKTRKNYEKHYHPCAVKEEKSE